MDNKQLQDKVNDVMDSYLKTKEATNLIKKACKKELEWVLDEGLAEILDNKSYQKLCAKIEKAVKKELKL